MYVHFCSYETPDILRPIVQPVLVSKRLIFFAN